MKPAEEQEGVAVAPPPPPLVEDAPPKLVEQSDLLEIAEGNVVSAGAVFVASIVLDALTALPTTVVVDVPTSMRTTALVLTALVAAPPVEADFLFEQRGLACVLLAATAFYGLHNGGVNARIADALYTLLCGWAVLLIFGIAGPKPGDRGHDAKGKRENVIALSAAFLGYAGARIVRSALYHPGEVTGFTASHEDIESRGYGVADDLVASALVFGGTLCVCAAGIILLNHDAIYERGCEPVATRWSRSSRCSSSAPPSWCRWRASRGWTSWRRSSATARAWATLTCARTPTARAGCTRPTRAPRRCGRAPSA